MSDQIPQGIQTASDIFALVDKTREGWAHRSNLIAEMEDLNIAALAAFIEELILINTAQLKVMGLLLERLENMLE